MVSRRPTFGARDTFADLVGAYPRGGFDAACRWGLSSVLLEERAGGCVDLRGVVKVEVTTGLDRYEPCFRDARCRWRRVLIGASRSSAA